MKTAGRLLLLVGVAACGGPTSQANEPQVAAVVPAATPDGVDTPVNQDPAPDPSASALQAPTEQPLSAESQTQFARGIALAKTEPGQALLAFVAAAQASGHNYLAHYNAAILYARTQKPSEAERAYRAALKAKPDFVPAVVGLAALREASGDVKGAEALLREKSTHADAAALLAQLLARQNKFDEARELAVASLKMDETNARAMLAMGMVYRRQGRFELASLALNQAIEVAPGFGEAFNELGLVLLAQDDKAKAVLAFEKAAQTAGHIAAIHNNLGVLRTEVGAFKTAVESLEEATRLSPKRAEYFLNLGNALRGDQRYADAEQAYKKAQDGGNRDALFNLGVLHLDNDLLADPVKRFTACLEYFKAYTTEAKPTAAELERTAEYVKIAEKAIENEEKRLAREKQRAEKEAEKRRQAEQNKAAEPPADAKTSAADKQAKP